MSFNAAASVGAEDEVHGADHLIGLIRQRLNSRGRTAWTLSTEARAAADRASGLIREGVEHEFR
jgi:hypothetical protein